jgi:hypothetical protein
MLEFWVYFLESSGKKMVKMHRMRIFSKDLTEKTWQFYETLTLISQKLTKYGVCMGN